MGGAHVKNAMLSRATVRCICACFSGITMHTATRVLHLSICKIAEMFPSAPKLTGAYTHWAGPTTRVVQSVQAKLRLLWLCMCARKWPSHKTLAQQQVTAEG